MAAHAGEDLSEFHEEELDIKEMAGGKLMTFRQPIEVLPKTRRTEKIQKQRIDDLKAKKEAAEQKRKEDEKKAAERFQREQQAQKRAKQEAERRKEAERKKREEEDMRKKMEGGLDQLLEALKQNASAPHITVCGIELNTVRLRVLCGDLAANQSCVSLCLDRKGLNDEDGQSLAAMLEKNSYLQKLEVEGNNLGVGAAETIGKALCVNTTLRSLNLESNNLTASGNDQKGIIELANALRENRSLRVLMLSKNGITHQAGEYFVKAIECNEMLTLVDLTGNDPSLSVDQLRRIDAAVRRNRERQSAIRRAERRERFALYNEEFKCRQHYMQVEAGRLEIEAHEERRLNRMQARFEKWAEEVKETAEEELAKYQDLMEEAADRAEANKNKGKKKKR